MRILLIKPNMGLVGGRPYLDRGRMEPLTFAVLAGFTPGVGIKLLADPKTNKTTKVRVFKSSGDEIKA